jgi:hypothetical protein
VNSELTRYAEQSVVKRYDDRKMLKINAFPDASRVPDYRCFAAIDLVAQHLFGANLLETVV